MTDPSSSTGQTALLLGATGAVGSQILSSLIASPHVQTIHSFVRKASSTPQLADAKVVEHVVDFENLCDGQASEVINFSEVNADSVYIALGTTRAAAGGAKPFERIDREYVLAAAKAARSQGTKAQKITYCSAQMANSSSSFLYPKSKGLTEEGLSSLGYSDVIIFRPGFLYGAQRAQPRRLENFYGLLTHNVLARLSDSAEIPTNVLGKCMVEAVLLGAKGLQEKGIGSKPTAPAFAGGAGNVVIIDNGQALKMGKML